MSDIPDLLGALIRSVEAAKAARRGECAARYGSNPDLCHLSTGHTEAHRNRYGTTWPAEETP